MSMIKEQSDILPDLDAVVGYDSVDSKKKLYDVNANVKPLEPNLHITSSSQNERHNASSVWSTAPDLPIVTVKLEIENADGKGCNVANHNASEPTPSIPSCIGESDDFVFTTNTSDSITIDQHKPMSPARITVDYENWIKKEPRCPTASSLTLNKETIVIHSTVDDMVSGNADLENDIAGKPLYSNNTPNMESDFTRVKYEPSQGRLTEQQQISEIMSGKRIPKVRIQKVQINSDWLTNGSKFNEECYDTRKTLTSVDPNIYSPTQMSKFLCRICMKKYVHCSAVKNHMIQKHPKSRDLSALVQKDHKVSKSDSQIVWFCPRNCKYLTLEYNALSEHLVTCDRAENLGPFNNEHDGDRSVGGLMVHTQQTEQMPYLPGQALEHKMPTADQDLNDSSRPILTHSDSVSSVSTHQSTEDSDTGADEYSPSQSDIQSGTQQEEAALCQCYTKFSCDWCFGLSKRLHRRTEVNCLKDCIEERK